MDQSEYRRQLAETAGFTGPKAEQFADLLVGETADELTESAARLVDLGKSLVPPPDLPIDPSQGMGDWPARADHGQAWMAKQMDTIAGRGRDPWALTLGW
ncbi:hypothetical protein [Pseudonocardia humida]|uniref:Uncharacterized protein n=1 Tax=Pseudonocardia humida TaxID=2800819 RepID=A0ABT1A9K1_9PSEU|nr:hypothetical protein [Pseudonocardia humida]MCO1659683.1 hypothetical protein [Pseudonocardia humida]